MINNLDWPHKREERSMELAAEVAAAEVGVVEVTIYRGVAAARKFREGR